MARPLCPPALLRCFRLSAALLFGALGCVDHNPTGTTLYVYDGASQSVQVWADVNTVLSATTVAAPDRTIQSSLLSGVRLAWGGLAVDTNTNRLYLVSETGTVYVITQASTQKGTISSTTDITTFSLGNISDHFASGAFGQAAVDQGNNILYVMETSLDGSTTRVWYAPGASTILNQAVVPVAQAFNVSGDTWGTGLAAVPGGSVIGLFGGGNTIYQAPTGTTYTGPRMWLGKNGAFPLTSGGYILSNSNVIIGNGNISGFASTINYGSLAYDSQRTALYAFGQGSPAVAVFNLSQFTSGGSYNQTPARTLGDPSASLANLRIISHPANGDWLLGANFTTAPSTTSTGTGGSALLIWKTPSGGGSAVSVTLPTPTSGSAPEIRGMTIGGTN